MVDMKQLEGNTNKLWMETSARMEQLLSEIVEASEIELQRAIFSKLNSELYSSIEAFGLDGITAYYQYCPMAFDNKGGYWFSDTGEIRNPYFGDMMLTCGEVKEVFEERK